ncbi:MAG: hypothetical protein A2Z49_09530 [Chloroflexi bacterium RBG_19FT_COMBO_56_12]|nr:MAG: hypothetical protein A2Z49_09530 [Chloroflexi bacterium RBG_19FT_COMBO_56_12]
MRKWALILILIILCLLPIPAVGQSEVIFTSVKVDIRPEYDRDSLLVMYDIELPQSALGSQLSLRIPTSAGAPFALAYGPGDGSLFDQQYEPQVTGEWTYINFSPPMAFLRLEYYVPALQRDGDARSFSYVWPGDNAVDAMTILVMQPYGASEMQITPGQWESRVDNNGLTFFGSEIGQVPAGEEIQIKVNYQKSVNDLTTEHLLPQPSGTIPDGAGANFEWGQIIPWVLGVLGAVMLGGGLLWYWQTGRQGQTSPRRQHRPRTAPLVSETPGTNGEAQAIYCHQCGNRASASDQFCRSCGTRLRSE